MSLESIDESPITRLLSGLDLTDLDPALVPGEDQNLIDLRRLETLPEFLITEELAGRTWVEWNPDSADKFDDPAFATLFQQLLKRCLRLGFRLDLLKEPSARLSASDTTKDDWISVLEEVANTCSLRVYVNSENHRNWLGSTQWSKSYDQLLDNLFWSHGLMLQPIKVIIDDSLTASGFRIEWNNLIMPGISGAPEGRVLVNDTVDRLTLLNIKGEETVNPASGSECAWIPDEYADIAEQAGLIVHNSLEYLLLTLEATIKRNAAAFVNRSLVDLLLFQLDQAFPETVAHIEKTVDRDFLVQVLRGLVEEGVSIRDLQNILDELLFLEESVSSTDLSKYIVFETTRGAIYSNQPIEQLNALAYVDMLRTKLKRFISHKYTRGGNTLVVYLIDKEIEERMANPAELSRLELTELLKAIDMEVGNLPPTAQQPVILTTLDIRRRIWELVRRDYPMLAVLSYQELSPDMNIQPIARISLE